MDKLLQQFLLIAKSQSVTAAAQLAGLSQPTITSNLKKIEQQLGVSLFERKSTGMVLTEYGQILYEHSVRMQHEYQQMLTRIEERKRCKAGKIRLGTGDAWWTLLIKPALHSHRDQFPSASIQVEFGNHLSLMDSLINDQIEFFIGHEIVGLSTKYSVYFTPLFSTYDGFFVNPNHPLLQSSVTDDMLSLFPSVTVTYDAEKYHHLLDDPRPKIIERHKQKLDERSVFEIDSLQASIDMALETNAVMPYPDMMSDYFSHFGLKSLRMEQRYYRGTVGIYSLQKTIPNEHQSVINEVKLYAEILETETNAKASNLI